MLGANKSDSSIVLFDAALDTYVVRRFGMKNIIYRLLWEVLDLAQLAVKDYLAEKENSCKTVQHSSKAE